MDEIFDREKLLIGNDGISKLQNAKVAVIGIGGVGGYVCEMLARSGIGTILICDFDNIDVTNINRQIIALTNNIGFSKTDAMESRLKLINPALKIIKYNAKLDTDLIDKLNLVNYDYIVDAIDDIHNKMILIKFAKENNINIVSALGAGNKICVPNYIVSDIYKTEYDKLAKVIRAKCRENNIKNLDVVYMKTDKSISVKGDNIGSISYHPCACGAVISAFVINKILGEIN